MIIYVVGYPHDHGFDAIFHDEGEAKKFCAWLNAEKRQERIDCGLIDKYGDVFDEYYVAMCVTTDSADDLIARRTAKDKEALTKLADRVNKGSEEDE